jgi:hypothetical protein
VSIWVFLGFSAMIIEPCIVEGVAKG